MAQITKQLIAEKALQLIDEGGLDNFSMRRLGKALSVDAKAVYYYYPNKENLLNAVLESAFEELILPEANNLSWQDQLRNLAKAYYQFALKHQQLIPLLLTLDGTVPAALHLVENMLAALRSIKISPIKKALIIDLFWSFLPSIALESSAENPDQGELIHQLQAASSDRFPAIYRLLADLKESDLVDDIDLQINILIWGIEELIRKEST